MGGEQAASVLATVRREQLEGNGEEWSADAEEEFRRPIREQYEREGHPYFSTARLWDDGIIEPGQTRMVLGLALGLVGRSPLKPISYGVFRM
jgi:3-methylcrotonyl-CoA carboxylase beta subunit